MWPAATDSSVPFGETRREERAGSKRRGKILREETQKRRARSKMNRKAEETRVYPTWIVFQSFQECF